MKIPVLSFWISNSRNWFQQVHPQIMIIIKSTENVSCMQLHVSLAVKQNVQLQFTIQRRDAY